MSLKVALATDEGERFVNRHFGDADYYYIYEVDEDKAEFILKIVNNSVEEEKHADPKKAKSIVKILKEEDVQVGVNLQFGPNIKRVKKHFVPVLIDTESIKEGLDKLQKNYQEIKKLWEQGEKRSYFKF